MNLDMKISGTQVYHRGQFSPLEVGIKDGRITEIGKSVGSARRLIHGKGRYLLPGIIDSHVHFRDPGETEKEDFQTGTRASARGGITTVVDMPNNKPPTTTLTQFQKKREIVSRKSLVNFALYAGIPEDTDTVSRLSRAGAIGFKYFMTDQRPDFEDIVKAVNQAGALLTVHAEDPRYCTLNPHPQTSPEAYIQTRPPQAELQALKKLSVHPPSRLHIAHLTLSEGLNFIGSSTTTEITPHHLLLSLERTELSDFTAVTNPPLRNESQNRGLQQAFKDGKIDLIASDHAPHRTREKRTTQAGRGSAGIPGVETILPLLLTFSAKNDIPLSHTIDRLTVKPARLFGFRDRGEIERGYWADLTIVDPSVERRVTGSNFHSRCKITPFEGWKLRFWPVMTIVNGKIVYANETFHSTSGGKFLHG